MRQLFSVYLREPDSGKEEHILVLAENADKAEEEGCLIAQDEWNWDGAEAEAFQSILIYDKHSAYGSFGCRIIEEDQKLIVEI